MFTDINKYIEEEISRGRLAAIGTASCKISNRTCDCTSLNFHVVDEEFVCDECGETQSN